MLGWICIHGNIQAYLQLLSSHMTFRKYLEVRHPILLFYYSKLGWFNFKARTWVCVPWGASTSWEPMSSSWSYVGSLMSSSSPSLSSSSSLHLARSSPLCQSLPFGLYVFVVLRMWELALVHLRLACNSTCEPSIDRMSTPSATMLMSNENWLHIVPGIVKIHRHRGITLANSSRYQFLTPAARPR
jgi:hypothetical protein